jgi:hypothetical protein
MRAAMDMLSRNRMQESESVSETVPRHWVVVLLALMVCLMAIRPGDGPWLNDEPAMMDLALWYNTHPCPRNSFGVSLPFTPAPFGLLGTRGVRYGPLPIWIDQILLGVTHNLVWMSAIRGLVVNGITAAALYWLSKTLGVSPWLAVVTMLSPWLWFYSRQLWDNSLCIPASALMLAAYADHLRTRRNWPLILAVLCGIAMSLIHLMSLAIVVPVALHALIRFRGVWKAKWSLALLFLLAGYISRPYWFFLFSHHHRDVPGGTSAWKGYFYPLLGAHHLSVMGLRNILGSRWALQFPRGVRICLSAAAWTSAIAYPLCWVGMVMALLGAWRAIWRWNSAAARDQMLLIALAVFAAQCGLDGYEHIHEGPHYFNATWIVFAIFVWVAANGLGSLLGRRIQQIGMCIAACALSSVTILIALSVARNSGIRSANYGTTLSNQVQAVEKISAFSDDSPEDSQFDQWNDHPIEKSVLMKLVPSIAGDRPKEQLTIRYRDASPTDAAIEVTASPLRRDR